jgi:hypothetical protein
MIRTKDAHQRTSHTPGPWHYQMEYRVSTIFAPDKTGENPYGTYIAEIDGQDVGRFTTNEQHEANARRICAAVNACKGLRTEALEEGGIARLLEALDYLLQQTVDMDLKHGITLSEGEEDARQKALAVIAEAAGL